VVDFYLKLYPKTIFCQYGQADSKKSKLTGREQGGIELLQSAPQYL